MPAAKVEHKIHVCRPLSLLAAAILLLLGGCATRPINPPITQFVPDRGYQYSTRIRHSRDPQNLVILAFSGGGMRAAAFSYGVLETLRRTEIIGPSSTKFRLLDQVDIIMGVSGGSFTALAYGLYGERLFDEYETRFLKRNVQGELIQQLLNPAGWANLASDGWGRSEVAAQVYDEALFGGATFADLDRGSGPMISVAATDLSTGSRLSFTQNIFDVLCSDLRSMRLSRAAAASSALPVVLSSVTITNYGGTCNYRMPAWVRTLAESSDPPRPAARAARRLKELQSYEDSARRPYIHLVDGAVSDNLGLRGVLDVVEGYEAINALGQRTPLSDVHRIIIFVVNAVTSPNFEWDQSEKPPGILDTLIRASGVPIDRNSFEAVEQLKDIVARWQTLRRIRDSPAFSKGQDAALVEVINAPDVSLYAIEVSFADLQDEAEREFLNSLPTSFALSDEAVDRLRAAAATLVLESPEFKRLLKDAGASIVDHKFPANGPTTERN